MVLSKSTDTLCTRDLLLSILIQQAPAVYSSSNMFHGWSQAECTELHWSLLLHIPAMCLCQGALHKRRSWWQLEQ